MKNDIVRISHETQTTRDRIKDNKEKIKVNKTLPYLVSNVIEVMLSSDVSKGWRKFSMNIFAWFSCSIWIHKEKKMKVQILISMLNGKANVQ